MSMRTIVGLALTLILGLAAQAIVKVNISVSDLYARADAVVLGTVAKADPAARTLEVTVKEVVKGTYNPATYRITFGNAADLPADATAGTPVVAILGRMNTLLYVGEVWRVAGQAGPDVATFTVGPQDARTLGDLMTAFPGRAPLFLALLADLKAGLAMNDNGELVPASTLKYSDGPIETTISHKGFSYIELVQDLGITNATCIWTGGLDKVCALPQPWPNEYATLLIANGQEVRIFEPAAKGSPRKYDDRTTAYGLDGAKARICAAGDLNADGKPDLLLGASARLQEGGTFAAAIALPKLPADSEWVAATIAEATGDKLPDIVVITKAGQLLTLINAGGNPATWTLRTRTLWTDGAAPAWAVFSNDWLHTGELCAIVVRQGNVVRYACGPTEGKADDLERLCGTPISRYTGFTPVDTKAASGRGGIPIPPGTAIRPLRDDEVLGACAIDFNGRRRLTDFLLLTRSPEGFIGGLPLGYRRYGTFIYNRGVTQSLDRRVKEGKTDLPIGTLPATGGVSRGRGQNLIFLKPNGELWQVIVAGG